MPAHKSLLKDYIYVYHSTVRSVRILAPPGVARDTLRNPHGLTESSFCPVYSRVVRFSQIGLKEEPFLKSSKMDAQGRTQIVRPTKALLAVCPESGASVPAQPSSGIFSWCLNYLRFSEIRHRETHVFLVPGRVRRHMQCDAPLELADLHDNHFHRTGLKKLLVKVETIN